MFVHDSSPTPKHWSKVFSEQYLEITLADSCFLHFNAAECPDSTFTLLSNVCYRTFFYEGKPVIIRDNYADARLHCLDRYKRSWSSVLATIKSRQEQEDVEKAIIKSKSRQALEVYTGLKVQKKTFLNSTVRWVDENNTALPYTNFADNQNPMGIACVLLSKTDNYKWITVNCNMRRARAIVCMARQGEPIIFV